VPVELPLEVVLKLINIDINEFLEAILALA